MRSTYKLLSLVSISDTNDNEPKNKSSIFLLGGTTYKNGRHDFLSKTVEIYKPKTYRPINVSRSADLVGQSKPPELQTGRRLHFAAVVNGTLIVGGGYTRGSSKALDTTEILDLNAPEVGWHGQSRMF